LFEKDKMIIYLLIGLITSIFFFNKKGELLYFFINIFLWAFVLPIAILLELVGEEEK